MLGQPARRTITPSPAPAISAGPPRSPTPAASDLIMPTAAAEMLGVSTDRLMRWRGTGGGPRFVHLGHRTVRYRRADIEAFIAGRVRSSTADG